MTTGPKETNLRSLREAQEKRPQSNEFQNKAKAKTRPGKQKAKVVRIRKSGRGR